MTATNKRGSSEGLRGLVAKWRKMAASIAEMFPVSAEVQSMGKSCAEHADELEATLSQGGEGPAGKASQIVPEKRDEMVSWLTDLNSNWAVLRNTRSFMEGQPSEYWKKFDACMGEAFELQIALMKLAATPAPVPAERPQLWAEKVPELTVAAWDDSERKVATFFCIIISIVAFCIGAACGTFNGHLLGVVQGRAEMKHWQDAYYYAVHPIKEAVPPRDSVLGYVTIPRSDYEYLVKRDYREIAPAPKPLKASKRACPEGATCERRGFYLPKPAPQP
jgi:hypothetical protein